MSQQYRPTKEEVARAGAVLQQYKIVQKPITKKGRLEYNAMVYDVLKSSITVTDKSELKANLDDAQAKIREFIRDIGGKDAVIRSQNERLLLMQSRVDRLERRIRGVE